MEGREIRASTRRLFCREWRHLRRRMGRHGPRYKNETALFLVSTDPVVCVGWVDMGWLDEWDWLLVARSNVPNVLSRARAKL